MVVTQLYDLVNDIASEALGKATIMPANTSQFVSLGKEVLNTFTTTEKFYKGLADRIGKTIIESRRYDADSRNTEMDTLTFGAAIQKIKYTGVGANFNTGWEDSDKSTINNPNMKYAGYGEQPGTTVDVLGRNLYGQGFGYDLHSSVNLSTNPMGIKQTIFSKKGTWRREVLVPTYQIESAFTSESNMISFINGIFVEIDNEFAIDKENLVNLACATLMAKKINDNKGVIHLLTDYNAAMGTTLTAPKAIYDADFLKYATMRMNNIQKYMRKMSTLYNNGTIKTFSKKEDLVVEILTDFASASASYLQADTYHKELVSLPRYTEVPYWQATGTTGSDLVTRSSIDIDNFDISSDEITQSYIIGMIRDKSAVGTIFDKMRVNSFFDPSRDQTSYYYNCETGYLVDDDYNCVIFVID